MVPSIDCIAKNSIKYQSFVYTQLNDLVWFDFMAYQQL